MKDQRFTGWIASLSNGGEAMEAPPLPGKQSSWQALLSMTRENGVRVTMLRLFRGGVTVAAMPARSVDGYFQAREAYKTMFSGAEGMRQGIGSVVGDKVYITWVNDFGTVWQDVRDLSEVRIHTTLSG